jgi:transglutaminase-like putative cysteine protease
VRKIGNIFFGHSFICMGLILAACGPQIPHIDSIDPRIGRAGETVSIRGNNFGAEREESYVTIAGISPTNSSYISWQDDHIIMKTPELGEAGLVYVYVKGKKSNGALFSNLASLPHTEQGVEIGLYPRIVSIHPQSAPVGSVITITGTNFGSSRERSAVLFNWEGEMFPSAPPEARTAEFIEAADTEFGYELWSEREIRVRVPDGAVSGNMGVRTLRGESRPFYFEVSGKPGAKTFGDKRSYTINYSVNIKVKDASGANTLYLWVPQPSVSAAQRNIELISRNAEPFVENYRGANLYRLINLSANSDVYINLSYKVDVYAVETTIRPQSVRQEEDSAVRTAYTQADFLIPSDNPQVKTLVNTLTAGERNPYLKAQRIYEWLIKECTIRTETEDTDRSGENFSNAPLEALSTKQADTYAASLLFCALARAAGVPSIPLSGVLVNRNRQTHKHYWAEFWIDGMGWIPVDPGMGAGAIPDFQTRADPARYYFGNTDSRRIAFSRGQVSLSQMDQRGRATGRTRSYSLQNLWEEAVGGIESYSSLWGDIIVTGIYTQ